MVVDRLARGFQDAGHEVLLFTTGDSTSDVPRQYVLEHSEGGRIGAAAIELRHVIAAYDAVQGFDIVHDHTLMGPLYAERYPDLHVVTTIHGPFNEELRAIYGRMAPRVPIIAVSHAQRKPAPEIPIARVIHHGIDVDAFPFGTGDGGYCVFLGRLSPDKGAGRAVDVARKTGVPLKIVGKMREPIEHDYFERYVAPYLNDEIEYLGEALVFPIDWPEPFGLVMIEALACGTPVLAFPEGAAPEVIEDGRTGFLCHDEAQMAELLDEVGTIDRSACRAAVKGYFSTSRMVREHLDLFADVVGR